MLVERGGIVDRKEVVGGGEERQFSALAVSRRSQSTLYRHKSNNHLSTGSSKPAQRAPPSNRLLLLGHKRSGIQSDSRCQKLITGHVFGHLWMVWADREVEPKQRVRQSEVKMSWAEVQLWRGEFQMHCDRGRGQGPYFNLEWVRR